MVIGAGGHAKVVIDLIGSMGGHVAFALEPAPDQFPDADVLGVPIREERSMLDEADPSKVYLAMGVGGGRHDFIQGLSSRIALCKTFKERGFQFPPLVHPSAMLGRDVIIGAGAQVMAGAVVQLGVSIGDLAIINTRASIDHDSTLGNGSHLGPGTTVAGSVLIGETCFLGIGTTVIHDIRIGDRVLAAAGAVIVNDVHDDDRVAGVPAKSF